MARLRHCLSLFFFNDTATTEIYTLSLHDALPICKTEDRHSERDRQRERETETEREKEKETDRDGQRDRDRERNRQTRSEEHTSELQSPCNLVCRLLLEKKKKCKSTVNTCPKSMNK